MRCLELLIDRQGEVVTQEDFINECWKAHGTYATSNSVRQTLFQLRRTLAEIGAPSSILQTRPRKGYCLVAGSVVSVSSAESSPVNETAVTTQDERPTLERAPGRAAFTSRRWVHIVGIMVLFCITAMVRWHWLVNDISYLAAGTHDGVQYFVQDGVTLTEAEIARTHYWLRHSGTHLENTSLVYINQSEPQNLSFFACQRPLQDKQNDCVPVNVLGKNKTP